MCIACVNIITSGEMMLHILCTWRRDVTLTSPLGPSFRSIMFEVHGTIDIGTDGLLPSNANQLVKLKDLLMHRTAQRAQIQSWVRISV